MFQVALPGANHLGRSVVPLADGGWVLVSIVQRQLGTWRTRTPERTTSSVVDPEVVATNTLDANRHGGVLLTRFGPGGDVAASEIHLVPGELWVGDAFLSSATSLLILGANNYAQFEAEVPIPTRVDTGG